MDHGTHESAAHPPFTEPACGCSSAPEPNPRRYARKLANALAGEGGENADRALRALEERTDVLAVGLLRRARRVRDLVVREAAPAAREPSAPAPAASERADTTASAAHPADAPARLMARLRAAPGPQRTVGDRRRPPDFLQLVPPTSVAPTRRSPAPAPAEPERPIVGTPGSPQWTRPASTPSGTPPYGTPLGVGPTPGAPGVNSTVIPLQQMHAHSDRRRQETAEAQERVIIEPVGPSPSPYFADPQGRFDRLDQVDDLGPGWSLASWHAAPHVRYVLREHRPVGWVEYSGGSRAGWAAVLANEVLCHPARPGEPVLHASAELAAHTIRVARDSLR
ncbi:hypothetical protein ACFZB9_19305 [Kitasatospora sp. NPDC008050]|uniref:hypothetical protein n=1 Tax=Kitasatospora sp. NPDC008050 TaxID=3364021 RepID=UPI0036E345EB